jgi:acyl transferase domain-containing protein
VVTGTVTTDDAGLVGFVFAGQGSQRAGMGAELHAASPVFAAAFDRACDRLEAELGVPVADVVLGRAGAGRADETLFAQAGLFALQVGLLALLQACGIAPDAVAGHSVGEVAAAYAAGVLSLEDACRLVAARARLMQSLPGGGAMTAVQATEAEVTEALAGVTGVSIAAVNGPASVVISGDADAVDQVAEGFAAQSRRARRLRVSHAFHSHRMDPVLAELGQVAAGLAYAEPRVPWACGLTGELVDECAPGYWVTQARQPVRFADAVAALAAEGVSVFIEIGPDGTLSGLGPAVRPEDAGAVFVPMLRPDQPGVTAVLTALARAHVHGVTVDWPAVLGSGNRVDLPTHAFQRQRFWPEMASWLSRAGRQVTEAWRYRVAWAPVPDPGPVLLSGSWLVVTGPDGGELAGWCERALRARGARVMVAEVAAGADRAGAAARIAEAVAGGPVAGVVSLAASLAGSLDGPDGPAGTLAVVQALGDARIGARLWVVTWGAVAAGEREVPPSPVQAMVWGLGLSAALEHPD